MDVAAHLEQLSVDGPLLADAAARAGWDARVASCDWTIRELVTHIGGVHRWAADIVRTGGASPDTVAGRSVGSGPDDAQLLDWFRDGHAELLDTLAAAPDDLEAFTFLPAPSAKAFWVRRQAHETAVHRADAESAVGAITAFDAAFAQDGIAEMLEGFAARKSNAVATPGTIRLAAHDGADWLITLGGERIVAARGEADGTAAADRADATISGTSSDLYLWLWNRPSGAAVDGDAALAASWQSVRVRWN